MAQMAGVSAGTVDRVIHNRGQVSEDNRQLILKIIDELNYKPNLLARSLATKRSYHIVTLLPETHLSKGYWEAPLKGIQKAAKEIADYNVVVTSLSFDQFKVETFRDSIKTIIDLNPDAVLLTPVFKGETIELAGILNVKSIPYIFIDSNIEGLGNLSYFGQHSYQSGYMAARLLEMGLPENSTIAILKPSGDISNQMVSRESGFNAFFEREGLKRRYAFKYIAYDLDNEVEREKQLAEFFNQNAPVAAALVFNSRVYEIASFLEKYRIENVRLVGYDLMRENAEYLRKGIVTFLLAQRPEEQGYYGVMTLFNYLVLKQDVIKVQYVPIDILTRENLDYYLNFK
ncbi:MAG: LacI family DNA-binding transcriptional regulator [Bacteroidota bacterium]|nr:LacI family DNA-binding transcriptional regulator [Bacteroidota bacterium]